MAPGGTGFTAPGQGPGPGPDQLSSEREPFFHWYKRKPIAWVGTGVTGVGFILGLSFSIAASSSSSTVSKHTAEIKAEDAANPAFNPTRRANLCGDKDTGAGALEHYVDACATLRKDVSAYHGNVAGAAVGWVFFGVGAIGTAAYAFIDWYPKKGPPEATAKAFAPHVVAVTPVVAPGQQGLGIVGTF